MRAAIFVVIVLSIVGIVLSVAAGRKLNAFYESNRADPNNSCYRECWIFGLDAAQLALLSAWGVLLSALLALHKRVGRALSIGTCSICGVWLAVVICSKVFESKVDGDLLLAALLLVLNMLVLLLLFLPSARAEFASLSAGRRDPWREHWPGDD